MLIRHCNKSPQIDPTSGSPATRPSVVTWSLVRACVFCTEHEYRKNRIGLRPRRRVHDPQQTARTLSSKRAHFRSDAKPLHDSDIRCAAGADDRTSSPA